MDLDQLDGREVSLLSLRTVRADMYDSSIGGNLQEIVASYGLTP